jgi:hypothetical protein
LILVSFLGFRIAVAARGQHEWVRFRVLPAIIKSAFG